MGPAAARRCGEGAGDRRVVKARRSMTREEPLPDAEVHSEGFRQTRAARKSALVEDYVELIAALIEDGNEARQVDIAARLGVAQPTVAKMLARLACEGLVTRKPYRGVFLTDAGRKVAEESRVRHRTVEASCARSASARRPHGSTPRASSTMSARRRWRRFARPWRSRSESAPRAAQSQRRVCPR